ncbi:TetR/AcrR family transcriptional regulator [Methylococcus mesophilus]|uniref:TetR/AcrR family transcriptional regulator n=1 Tax=Methylococcus mesophilus TaxID=2993564 RepID=UPI00224B1983|nr:TetR/AcrR family transcriptional regulator [Methylococcus mesophilus]UZR29156.1 TetR/AcrR family transcriptional regulator [Methylococcus mesophilus]
MARPAKIEDSALLERLSDVFREVGYEAASLAVLSEASGLKKASLYHRFPGGKEQMAHEVMARAEAWLSEHILAPLKSGGAPEVRIRAMIRSVDAFYSGGRQACLLNMLSSPRADQGPFANLIKNAFEAWIEALSAVLTDAGFDEDTARFRAERAIALLQGSLVVSRGMGTTRPFQNCLANLERELLTSHRTGGAA